jgi:hypothetical protein
MVDFQDSTGRSLPRDDYFAQVVDLVIAIRVARVAWEPGPRAHGEWFAFAKALRSGIRNGVTLPVLIEEARSWTAGWWRRARFPRGCNEVF